MEKIGFIGLGIMGRPMARNLLKAGFELVFHARRTEVVAGMEAAGGKAAPSSKAVAETADIVITIVTADAQVREVILGPDGVLAGSRPGSLIVDMSTISPLTIREIAGEAAGRQVAVIDAPVSGGDTGAEAGTLTIIAGGQPEDVERCRPLFEAMGKQESIFHVGPLGAGQTVKLVNQVIGGVNMAMIAEGLCLGVKAGVDPEIMRQVISVSSGNSGLFEARVADFILANRFQPGFMLDLMKKDVGLAVDLGKELDLPMPIGAAAYQMYAMASALGAGEEDFSAVCRAAQHASGVQIAEEGQ